jgi:MarR family transcriptional regulator, organic hydroperoxide resistance regulator
MDAEQKIDLIRQVMGASHIFCSAVNEMLERTLGEATDEALAMSQVKLLLLISRPEQRFKVTDVAEFLGVTNAAASRAIERLVQRGLVDRTVSRDDRRAVDLSLTEESRDLLDRFTEIRNRELMQLLAHYPEDKLRTAIRLLDELSVLLLDFEPGKEDRCLRCGVHFRSGCVLRDVLGRECAVSAGLYGTPHDDDEPHGDEPQGDEPAGDEPAGDEPRGDQSQDDARRADRGPRGNGARGGDDAPRAANDFPAA